MKIFVVVLLMVLSVMILVSCQSTPDKPIVFNKNENDIEESMRNENNPNSIIDSGESLYEEFNSSDGYINIVIDAELEVSGNGIYPVLLVQPHFFSNDDIKDIVSSLYKNTQLYLYTINKDVLEEDILMYKADLASLKKEGRYSSIHKGSNAGEIVINPEEEIEIIENKLSQLEDEYSRATGERIPITNLELSNEQEGISSLTIMDGQDLPSILSVYISEPSNISIIHYENYQGRTYTVDSATCTKEDFILSKDEAEKQAVLIANELCKDDMDISSTEIMKSDDGQYCYLIRMARLINGAPCYYIETYDGTLAFGVDGSEYREPWQAERISIMIDDNGIIGFEWINPPQTIDIINNNVALLDRDEIISIAVSCLQHSLSKELFNEQEKNVMIDRVVLHMMRIAKKDSNEEYYYIPVYDFLGHYGEKNIEQVSFLTLNAIDGSVIDRGLGY